MTEVSVRGGRPAQPYVPSVLPLFGLDRIYVRRLQGAEHAGASRAALEQLSDPSR